MKDIDVKKTPDVSGGLVPPDPCMPTWPEPREPVDPFPRPPFEPWTDPAQQS